MTVGVLLLAAGRSRRFGSDKRQAVIAPEQTLLQASIQPIQQAGLPLRVCLAAGDQALQQTLRSQNIKCLLCPGAERGMGATLADGVRQLPAWQGILVALADMPDIQPDTFRRVALDLATDAIHIPLYQGRRGHPVGFGRHYFAALQRLDGDVGARGIIDANPDKLREIAVADAGIHTDIDHPGQL